MRRDPGGTIALFPSDHHFRESSIFRATVDRALRLARICEDRLLLIGAPATYPEVEYGWIQPRPILTESPSNSLQYVSRFWEKPSLAEANVLQTYSAELAAALSLPFAFASHFAPALLFEAIDPYCSRFKPSVYLDNFGLALYGVGDL